MTALGLRGLESVPNATLDATLRGVLLAASKDPDAKLTFIATDPREESTRLCTVVKIPTTPGSTAAVETEGRMLVSLRRTGLESVASTIPRYIANVELHGQRALVSTAMPGVPMSVAYHQWWHTARRTAVQQDFSAAAEWLRTFQEGTQRGCAPVTWPDDVRVGLTHRWKRDLLLAPALAKLEVARRRLSPLLAPVTAVHGDFWFGNLLLDHGIVSGVVDWEGGEVSGSPLRDLARFPLSYCLYLDRHTRMGHRVLGHRGLRRSGFGDGVAYGLEGPDWLPRLVRGFIGDGLARLGLSRTLWYDVALVGIGEIAAVANDQAFARGHLALLAGLPSYARRTRR